VRIRVNFWLRLGRAGSTALFITNIYIVMLRWKLSWSPPDLVMPLYLARRRRHTFLRAPANRLQLTGSNYAAPAPQLQLYIRGLLEPSRDRALQPPKHRVSEPTKDSAQKPSQDRAPDPIMLLIAAPASKHDQTIIIAPTL
jgi:hypothetical protein